MYISRDFHLLTLRGSNLIFLTLFNKWLAAAPNSPAAAAVIMTTRAEFNSYHHDYNRNLVYLITRSRRCSGNYQLLNLLLTNVSEKK